MSKEWIASPASENRREFSPKAQVSFNKLVKWVSSHKMTNTDKKTYSVFKSEGRIKLVATAPSLKTRQSQHFFMYLKTEPTASF